MKHQILFVFVLAVALAFATTAPAASGGPDAYGYTWDDTETYAWNDISGTGTLLTLSDDDEASLAPGFDLFFYDASYTNVSVSSNGHVVLGAGGDLIGVECADWTTYTYAIYGYWTDMNPSSIGAIYWETQGAAPNRKFIVQYDGVPVYGNNANTGTFQLVFEEATKDIVVYIDDPFSAGDDEAVIGIHGATVENNLYAECADGAGTAGTAYRFAYPGGGDDDDDDDDDDNDDDVTDDDATDDDATDDDVVDDDATDDDAADDDAADDDATDDDATDDDTAVDDDDDSDSGCGC